MGSRNLVGLLYFICVDLPNCSDPRKMNFDIEFLVFESMLRLTLQLNVEMLVFLNRKIEINNLNEQII